MLVLANVIFPAFATPYVYGMLFPVASIAAVTTEVIVFRLINRELPWIRIVGIVVLVNVVSAILGFAIAAALPSGLEPTMLGEGENRFQSIAPGPKYATYAMFGWLLAFALSVVIESGIVKMCFECTALRRPFVTVGLANIASYVTLFLIALMWARFFW